MVDGGAASGDAVAISGVLFDLGGTLLDTADPIGWAAVAEGLGLEVDPEHIGHAFREVTAALDAGDPSIPPEPGYWGAILQRASGRPVDAATGARFLEAWRATSFEPPLFSDARYCLTRLQEEGLALGVLSNSDSEARVRGHLTRTGILRFFSAVVSSGTEGVRKPDPRLFRIGAERLARRPEEIVYVGDLANGDARAASSAGLNGVWLNRFGWGFGDDPPEITSLGELPGFVRRVGEGPR
jgi:putative hydrolase of the HAD superfamily